MWGGAIACRKWREWRCQILHRHIVRHIVSILWSDGFPAGFCAPQLPAHLLLLSLQMNRPPPEEYLGFHLETRPAVVALDFDALHLELLDNDQRQLPTRWIIVSEHNPQRVAYFRYAFGHFLGRWPLISWGNDDT